MSSISKRITKWQQRGEEHKFQEKRENKRRNILMCGNFFYYKG
jgi:hypothetical protein